jgi:hypothetical protein
LATQEQIADYIRRNIAVGRVHPGATYWHATAYRLPYRGPALPAAEQIATGLIEDAEFRALQAGGFLNTPTGEFVEEAVALAVPRTITPEFDLIVDALKLAAALQQGRARRNVLLGAAGSAAFAFVLYEIGSAA